VPTGCSRMEVWTLTVTSRADSDNVTSVLILMG